MCQRTLAASKIAVKDGPKGRRNVFRNDREATSSDGRGIVQAAEKWKIDFAIDGVDGIELRHLYRNMAWLGERIIQIGLDPLSAR
jgi:hypothetical protein